MLQLNLLPDVKKEFLHAQRQRNLVMYIAILASLISGGVVIILGLIMGGQLVQKNILTGNIDNDKQTIQGFKTGKQLDEYLTVQNQLSQIDSLKEAQPIYSRLFDYLQQLNPADPNSVELSSAMVTTGTGSATGATIQLQGSTASFASLDVYKTTLARTTITYSNGPNGNSVTETLFSSVSVSSAGLSQDSGGSKVSFTINLTFNAAAFRLSSVGITLKVPQETTSDADRNAPGSVFNGQPAGDQSTADGSDTDSANGAGVNNE